MARATATSKVTAQNQTSVPASVRKTLGIRPGTELMWLTNERGEVVVRPKKYTLEQLGEVLKKRPVRAFTVEEMDEAIAAEIVDRFKRAVKKSAKR